MKAPFVKTVRTARACYVYDVNTGQLLQIPPAVADVLEDWPRAKPRGGRPRALSGDSRSALRFVRELQATTGLFSGQRPAHVRPTLGQKEGTLPSARGQSGPRLTGRRGKRPLFLPEDSRLCSHFILSITESCNFRCRYCVYSSAYPTRRAHSRRTMPWSVARKAIDLLAGTSRKTGEEVYLGFYGGEPLLRFDFIKRCVAYARRRLGKHPHRFSITTNASLLSDEVVDYLVGHRFIVTISLDGPEEVHDRNRRFADGRGTFERVVRGMERVRERAGADYFTNHVILNAVLAPPCDLEKLHRFFSRYPSWLRLSSPEYRAGLREGKGAGRAGAAATAGAMKDYCLRRRKDDDFRLAGVSLPFECFHRELRKFHTRPMGPMEDPAGVLGLCRPGRTRAFVSSRGKIYVCERVEDNDNMVIGTVDTGIDEDRVSGILDGVAGLDFSRCRDCWLVRMCNMCFAHMVYDGRWSEEKWRFSCEMRRRHYADALRLYCEIMEEDEEALDFLKDAPSPVA